MTKTEVIRTEVTQTQTARTQTARKQGAEIQGAGTQTTAFKALVGQAFSLAGAISLSLLLSASVSALEPQDAASYRESGGVTPQQAEQYLESRNSPLISNHDADQVNSYYYFGVYEQRTLIGLERVRADDYSQHFSLLVFDGDDLFGYYQNIASLPLFIEPDGQLSFPRGAELEGQIFIQQDVFPALCLRDKGCVEWQSVDHPNDQSGDQSGD